ncbi:T9SS type A sorting domain-containing protein [Aegicerativicinus sediminis]|uniref:hypothetical protein n=1 Tax=Aegicerativicinus sediminis TaxID=2893202 RepID=UPI001E4530B1|nr:hypothetical protein [Aegicerativicinus sediminis]
MTQTITVRDITSPTWTTSPGADATIDCPSEPVFTAPTASDECSTATVNEISDVTTPGSCTGTYVRTKTWEAVDDCGNKSSQVTQTITVRDITDPVITYCPLDIVIECDESEDPANTGQMTATDTCSDPVITYSDKSTPNGCQQIIVRTWRAEDACGNFVTCTQNIIVRDRTAPTFTGCDGIGDVTASDNCSATENITLFYRDNGTTRTWTAIDESGNINTCDQDLSVQASASLVDPVQTNSTLKAEGDILVKAFPNPFEDSVKFLIDIPEAGEGTLDLVNILGQKIQSVHSGKFVKGTNSLEVKLKERQTRMLFYVLNINGKKKSGKLIQSE